jgi:hypothetical protein
MIKILAAALFFAAAVFLGANAASAAPTHAAGVDPGRLSPTTAFAQVQIRRPRARTRITVRPPIYYPYRTYSTTYPTPYPIEYPGPGAVRQCTAKLVPENRPSGTVIVPTTTCWWERP